jgi:hypothetical protein
MDSEEMLPMFGNVDEWVRDWLRETWQPEIDGRRRIWLARWWEVREAWIRLEALWLAWEAARLDSGTGMSAWWVYHADHHLPILTSMDGPFARGASNSVNYSRAGEPLAYTPPDDPGIFGHTKHISPCLLAQTSVTGKRAEE